MEYSQSNSDSGFRDLYSRNRGLNMGQRQKSSSLCHCFQLMEYAISTLYLNVLREIHL